MIIAFVGHSGSGKSTLMKYLNDFMGFHVPDWYTTRAPRGPQDDEYHFLSPQEFLDVSKHVKLEEVGINYGNMYATSYDDPIKFNYATVTDPTGAVESTLTHKNNYVAIYVECDEQVRLHRMLCRGDDPQLAQERIAKDSDKFKDAFHVCDYKITSSHDSPKEDVKELISIIRDIEHEKGVKLVGRV